MQLTCGPTFEEEGVQLLIPRRLECLGLAALAQPAVLGGAVHRAEHLSRAQRRRQLLHAGGVVEVAVLYFSVHRDPNLD